MERFIPVSSGGILYHDISFYKKVIEKLLYNRKNTLLITSYDPWFSLKLGNYFKRKYKELIWVADFRDPSFNIHDKKISKLIVFKTGTKKILKFADLVTVVSKQMQEEYSRLTTKKVVFLPNGYDGKLYLEDNNLKTSKSKNSLIISYTGSLHPETIEIFYFAKAFQKAIKSSSNIKFVFNYAGFHSNIVNEAFSKNKLKHFLKDYGFLKREQALELQKHSDILLLIAYTGDDPRIGKGIRTGKVYEYLASGKPIIVIAPKNWEMKEEVESDGISKVFEKNQTEEIANYLINLAKKDKITLNFQKRKEVIVKYLHKNLAIQLEKELNCLVTNNSGGKL